MNNKLSNLDNQKLEELLKCKICYDTIKTAVVTACSHNYCSLCIRKYLLYKTECPMCFQETFEKDLRPNRILDDMVQICFQNQSTQLENLSQETSNCNRVEATDNLTNKHIPESLLFDLSPKKIPKVSCPNCNVDISKGFFEKHFDVCSKPASSASLPKVENTRKHLPKLVLNLMKDTELRKKMKELGLPSQGNRKTLEKRYQKYHILYNTECDKKNPRDVKKLIKQCLDEETLENNLLKKSDNKIFNFTKKSEQSEIDEAKNNYLKKNSDNYNSLINQIKSRTNTKKTVSSLKDSNSNLVSNDKTDNITLK